jgi:hypothetical protein
MCTLAEVFVSDPNGTSEGWPGLQLCEEIARSNLLG